MNRSANDLAGARIQTETTEKIGKLTIVGDDPSRSVSPIFSNFLAVSNVAGEVQFEFIFVDLNGFAHQIEAVKAGKAPADISVQGKTVAKVIMPAASFVQLRDHLNGLFDRLEGQYAKSDPEEESREGDNG